MLCFIARIDSEWLPTDTVGRFLKERLPEIVKANEGDPTVAEAREGAPATGFLKYLPGSVVITAEIDIPQDLDRGTLLLGHEPNIDPRRLMRGAVVEVRDVRGTVIARTNPALVQRFPKTFEGRWIRLPARPRSTEPLKVLEEAAARWPALNQPVLRGGPDVVGIVFQDEVRFKENHDLWAFVVRRRDRDIAPRDGGRLPPGDRFTSYLACPDRAGLSDVQIRTPRLARLAGKKAVVCGLGALGSSVAMQLAKAGIGHLHMIDHDYVQAGNTPRWALGWGSLGWPKVQALGAHIFQNYPYVHLTTLEMKIGAPLPPELAPGTDLQALERAFTDAHIVVDCTVETTVHHYLSRAAWMRGIPYLWASATPGAWGGTIGRAQRDVTQGCWLCFKHHQTAGAYRRPPAEDSPDVQPVGCFSPTFTGTGADLDVVAIGAARLAFSTLLNSADDGYPDVTWDIGVVATWGGDGRPIAPNWSVYKLDRHGACDQHG